MSKCTRKHHFPSWNSTFPEEACPQIFTFRYSYSITIFFKFIYFSQIISHIKQVFREIQLTAELYRPTGLLFFGKELLTIVQNLINDIFVQFSVVKASKWCTSMQRFSGMHDANSAYAVSPGSSVTVPGPKPQYGVPHSTLLELGECYK